MHVAAEALSATPPQSLTRLRMEILEEAAKVAESIACEDSADCSHPDCDAAFQAAGTIRKLAERAE
jgi:hypothetical protein